MGEAKQKERAGDREGHCQRGFGEQKHRLGLGLEEGPPPPRFPPQEVGQAAEALRGGGGGLAGRV